MINNHIATDKFIFVLILGIKTDKFIFVLILGIMSREIEREEDEEKISYVVWKKSFKSSSLNRARRDMMQFRLRA